MITQECIDELGSEIGLHPSFSSNGLQSPSKVPKEALFPGLSPLVESGILQKPPSSRLLQRYHNKIIAANAKLEKPGSDQQCLPTHDNSPQTSPIETRKEIAPTTLNNESEETKERVHSEKETTNTSSVEINEGNVVDQKKQTEAAEGNISNEKRDMQEINLIDFSEPSNIRRDDCSNCLDKKEVGTIQANEASIQLKDLRIERLPKPFSFRNFHSGQGNSFDVYQCPNISRWNVALSVA